MSIRTYQANYSDQSSMALGTLLRDFDTGLTSLWVPCVARSLNRSRVVAREGPHAYTQLGEFPEQPRAGPR